MSGTAVMARKGHPKKKTLKDALAEDEAAIKARKGAIDKRATMIKAPGVDTEAGLDAPMRPTDEQLKRINQYTRSPKTADEVVCFTTLSMNDIEDRDEDKFTTECVKDFAALKDPFSFTGKSYMLDHQYSVGNAVGRIFGTDTKKVSGATFLTNEVYMPNTEQFAPLIEKIDYGINWAVSVGVVLGKDECSLSWCKAPFSSWGWWCQNGHDKGAYYVEDADEDSWGYPLPCDSRTTGAEKCIRLFMQPRDAYELSQVFLGAQFYAQLEKEPDFKSVMKAATAGVPTIGVNSEIAAKLPMKHLPDKVAEAFRKHTVTEDDDGTLSWVDEHKMVWSYDPESPENKAVALGKATNKEESEDGATGSERGSAEDGEGDDADPDSGNEVSASSEEGQLDGGSGSEGDQASEGGEQQRSAGGTSDGSVTAAADDEDDDDDSESDDDSDDDDDDDSEDSDSSSDNTEGEKGLSKADVVAAARRAKLPEEVITATEKAEGNGLAFLLRRVGDEVRDLRKTNKKLTAKATVADKFVEDLKAEALDAYVRANAGGEGHVDTSGFERMLQLAADADDVDAIKFMIEEQTKRAQEKFPSSFSKAPRRSSHPSDPNEEKTVHDKHFEDDEESSDSSEKIVSRIHG